MNSVFKKSYKTLLFTLTLGLTYTSSVSANECATVKFKANTIDNDSYIINVAANNGQPVFGFLDEKSIAGSPYYYYLEEGQHTLTIEKWPIKAYELYKRYKGNGKRIPPKKWDSIIKDSKIETKVIGLNVKAAHSYDLSLVSTALDAQFELLSATPMACIDDVEEVLPAKNSSTIVNSSKDLLPVTLENRLRQTMTKISQFHQAQSTKKEFSNIVPLGVNFEFGAILDRDYNAGNIKILSVLPYSFASKLGLASGDIITELSGRSVLESKVTANAQYLKYLSSIKINKNVKIKIVRNNKELELERKFVPIILPEARYLFNSNQQDEAGSSSLAQRNLVSSATLSYPLKFEFDQTILAVSNFYNEQGIKQGTVHLNRMADQDPNYGLAGDLIQLKQSRGLRIARIVDNSPAQSIGLREEDIIITINGESISGLSPKVLSEKFIKLNAKSTYSLSIIRANKILELTGVYQPKVLAGFDLNLDLSSVAVTTRLLTEYAKNERRIGLANDRFLNPSRFKQESDTQYYNGVNNRDQGAREQARTYSGSGRNN